MIPAKTPYRKLVLVCTNQKENARECCVQFQGVEIHTALKMALAGADPSIRVTKAGCMGNCVTGTTVVIMPDNIWLGRVTIGDIPELVKMIV